MYCTIDDLLKRVPEQVLIDLTDDTRSGAINTVKINTSIYDAGTLINSALCNVYELPLSEIPEVLVRISCDLALYFIYRNRYDDKMPDEIKNAYNNAVIYLNKINTGKSLIDANLKLKHSKILTNNSKDDRFFGKETMELI